MDKNTTELDGEIIQLQNRIIELAKMIKRYEKENKGNIESDTYKIAQNRLKVLQEEHREKYNQREKILGNIRVTGDLNEKNDIHNSKEFKAYVEFLISSNLQAMVDNAENYQSIDTQSLDESSISNQEQESIERFELAKSSYTTNISVLKELSTDKEKAKIEMLDRFAQNIDLLYIPINTKIICDEILSEIHGNTLSKIEDNQDKKSKRDIPIEDKKHYFIGSSNVFVKMNRELKQVSKLELKRRLLEYVIEAAHIIEEIQKQSKGLEEIKEKCESLETLNSSDLVDYVNAIIDTKKLKEDYEMFQNDIVDGISLLEKLAGENDIDKIEQIKQNWGNIENQTFPNGFIDIKTEEQEKNYDFAEKLFDEYYDALFQEKIKQEKANKKDIPPKTEQKKEEIETGDEISNKMDFDKLLEINQGNTDTKEQNQKESNLPVLQKRRNPFSWIKSKVSNLLKRFSKKENTEDKENLEYNNDSKRREENNFRKEITGEGKYNTGALNIKGLYQHIDSQEQEQQAQKDNIKIENQVI